MCSVIIKTNSDGSLLQMSGCIDHHAFHKFVYRYYSRPHIDIILYWDSAASSIGQDYYVIITFLDYIECVMDYQFYNKNLIF